MRHKWPFDCGLCHRLGAWSSEVTRLCVHAVGQCPQWPRLPASLKLLRLVSDHHISVWEPAIPWSGGLPDQPSFPSAISGVTHSRTVFHMCVVVSSQGSDASCAGGGCAVHQVVSRRACGLGWDGRYGPVTPQRSCSICNSVRLYGSDLHSRGPCKACLWSQLMRVATILTSAHRFFTHLAVHVLRCSWGHPLH